jgi:phosphotriesterase-related protein
VIETVLGPIAPEALGATSMHEHLLMDARALLPEPSAARGFYPALAATDPMAVAENLVLDDPELAADELARVLAARQRSVLDPTVWGFGGPAAALPEISRRSGVQVVAGVGAYLPRTRPAWLRSMSVDDLVELFRTAILDRLPGCEHRAGVVGMIATGHPLSAEDERLLLAAAVTAATTGTALLLRIDPRFRDHGPELVSRARDAGVDAGRIVLSNVDGYAASDDLQPIRDLAATGATLSWCFGYEAPPRAGLTSATDAQRIEALSALLSDGVHRQVLACGIWTKSALHAFGGHGYDHLGRRVLPTLRERGLSPEQIDELLVAQPRRLLDR